MMRCYAMFLISGNDAMRCGWDEDKHATMRYDANGLVHSGRGTVCRTIWEVWDAIGF